MDLVRRKIPKGVDMAGNLLIIVDMLNDFIHEKGALFCGPTAQQIVPNIALRLADFRKQGDTVIYLQDAHDPDDREFEMFPKHCISGSWGSEIIAALKPLPDELILTKKRYSGFFGTDLDQELTRLAPEKVVVVGVCTSICVMDTVGGLANRDYRAIVPRGEVADFDPEFHQFALKRMKQLYGATIE
jgi:nicotinamidase/pyrazinamidase